MGLAGRCLSGCYGGRGGARRCCGAALRRAGSAAGLPRALSFRAALAMGPGHAPRSPLPALYATLLLLLLLPPPPAMGAGERRRLACTTCRGIVDRFNQVSGGDAGCRVWGGRLQRGSPAERRGLRAMRASGCAPLVSPRGDRTDARQRLFPRSGAAVGARSGPGWARTPLPVP